MHEIVRIQVKSSVNVYVIQYSKEKECDLCDFNRGTDVDTGWAGLSI